MRENAKVLLLRVEGSTQEATWLHNLSYILTRETSPQPTEYAKRKNSFASSSINLELSAYSVVVGHYGELRCHGVSSWEPVCD